MKALNIRRSHLLLALTRAAADGRGTTRVLEGVEVARIVTDKSIYLAIGPTDSIRDVKRSLNLFPTKFPLINESLWAHSGYLEAALLVFAHYVGQVGSRKVLLAGHSMGGAIARMLALLFRSHGREVVWLETYGEPAGLIGSHSRIPGRRYVNGLDPVPFWCPGYAHTCSPVEIESSHWLCSSPLDHRLYEYEESVSIAIQNASKIM